MAVEFVNNGLSNEVGFGLEDLSHAASQAPYVSKKMLRDGQEYADVMTRAAAGDAP